MNNRVQFHATPRTVTHQAPLTSIYGIFQARILEWVAISYPREWSQPRDRPVSLAPPALAGEFFTTSATWEAPNSLQFSSVQSLSHVRLFATLWTAAHQASMNTSFKFLLGRDRFSLCILQIISDLCLSQH